MEIEQIPNLDGITTEQERAGLRRLFDLGVELPIPPEMTRKVAGYIAALEQSLANARADAERRFTEHTTHVGRFLTEMYQTMVDPVLDPDPELKIAGLYELLLHQAREDREKLNRSPANLPADWSQDSSLETWFPLTAEELTRTKADVERFRLDGEREVALYKGERDRFQGVIERLTAALTLARPVLDEALQTLCQSYCPPCKVGEFYDYSELSEPELGYITRTFRPRSETMLETELKYLSEHKDDLNKEYPGRFLVIKGQEVSGAYETREAALTGAIEKHGLTNVLIRRPEDAEETISIPALTYGLIDAHV